MMANSVSFPKDWPIVSIGDLVTEFRGGAPLKPSDFTRTGVKVLPKGGVSRKGWLDVEDGDLQYCSLDYAERHHRNLVDETYTIVVLRDLVPSGPSIALMVQIRFPGRFVLAQGVYGFKLRQDAAPGFLVQMSYTSWYRKLANSIMVGSTQVHITNTAFKSIQIPLPPLLEQEAIVETLSDTGALIESLEQLLIKKRLLKQAAMQELLSGKKRLRGFQVKLGCKKTVGGVIPEDWNVTTLIALSIEPLQNGVFYKPSLKGTGVKLINVGDLYDRAPIDPTLLELFDATEKECERFRVEDGDLFFTRSSVVPSGIAHCNIYRTESREPVVFDSHVIRLRPDTKKVVPSFLFLFCVAPVARRYLVAHAKTATMTTIDQRVLGQCPVFLPTKAEQEAIATVISDFDAEISDLEAQLTKTRAIKQGMVQKLLNGEIRLI